jgi:hypothetical protein
MDSTFGRAKGGHARASALSPEERREIAAKGAKARWRIRPIEASHAGVLTIGDKELACANLPDGRRVISETTMMKALGRVYSGYYSKRDAAANPASAVLPRYLAPAGLRPYISDELINLLRPIPYVPPESRTVSKGVNAEAVPQICEVWLKARAEGVLSERQSKTANEAEIIVRGLARVGIIALVDEATGFQDDRPKRALAKILEAFIAKELQPWIQTFPAAFYREIFRLRGLDYQTDTVKRPRYFGIITNDIVYKRIAPGVLAELKRVVERDEHGRPKHKYFQRLTSNIGYPKLREHLGSVCAIMQLSDGWHDFMGKLNRLHPRFGGQLELPFEMQTDDGRGL